MTAPPPPELRGDLSPVAGMVGAISTAVAVIILELCVFAGSFSLEGVEIILPGLTIVVAIPAIVLGLPLWGVMHTRGGRTVVHTMVAGMAASMMGIPAFALLISGADIVRFGALLPALFVLILTAAIPGATGGIVFQLIAYRTRF